MAELHPTSHIPCFEVVLICTNAYLADVKDLVRRLKAAHEQVVQLETGLKGIDYSKYIGDYVPPRVDSNNAIYEQVLRLTTYSSMFEAYKQELKPHAELIWSVTYGAILWRKYIENATWSRLSRDYATSRSTLVRQVHKAREGVYRLMPEQYRRYSIPNATPNAEPNMET